MRQLLTIARQEWRLQFRSGRFRTAVLAYVVLSAVPVAMTFFVVRRYSLYTFGPSTYLAQTLLFQPCLLTMLAILLAGARTGEENLREQWSPLSSAPLSNLGFLVRRWLALLTLFLPLTWLPLLVAAVFAYAAETPVVAWQAWGHSWLVVVLPRALLISAGWLALVTIAGSEFLALLVGMLGFAAFQTLLNQILLRFRMTLDGVGEWFGIEEVFRWFRWAVRYVREEGDRQYHPEFAASEGSYDWLAAWDWTLPRMMLIAAWILILLVSASKFLGRTRRDLRPLRIGPKHPLRTYIRIWNEWRTRHAPDAAAGLGERLAMAFALALALCVFGLLLHRLQSFGDLAGQRFVAWTKHDGPPLPETVRPTSWRISGEIHAEGRVELEGQGGLKNRGEQPVEELAFTLNAGLQMHHLEAEGRQIETTQHWDRLRLRLDPPLAPGQELKLRWRLRGTPVRPAFGLRRYEGFRRAVSFVRGYQEHSTGRFTRDLIDLSRGQMNPVINARRVDLQPGDLTPVPRYSTWKLTPPQSAPTEYGQTVPLETLHFDAEVEIDLTVPGEWFLADVCAHASRTEDGRGRLTGRCRVALSQLMVRGGALERLEEPSSEVALAVLPAHRDRGRNLLRSLATAARLSERAWPGSEGLEGFAVIEWPPAFHVGLTKGVNPRREYLGAELNGLLLSIPEGLMISPEPLEGEELVARHLVLVQLRRREYEARQSFLFYHLFRGLMFRRMGLDKDGATTSGPPWWKSISARPIMRITGRDILKARLSSVMVEVESRVGSQHLYQGIETFLNRKDAPPGSMEELFADLEAASGVSLKRMYEDYFLGNALPELLLEDVGVARMEGGGWRVHGKVRNVGSGEVKCPVVVKAEVGESKLMVTVDTESATSFDVSLRSRPLTVLLDPNKTCYRFVNKNSSMNERVYLQGAGA